MRKRVLYSPLTAANGGRGYYPKDIFQAYNFPNHLDGSGQTIGILEFSNGYSLNDAQQFWMMHGISAPTVVFVSVDGTRNDHGKQSQDEEASLDLQWASALAPKAKIVVYEASAGRTNNEFAQAMIRALKHVLNDTTHHPSVLSISYGDAESTFRKSDLKIIAKLIRALSHQGVTVCIASGDQGAYGMQNSSGSRTRHADAPASSPFAVAVGGTHLSLNGVERAWTYLSARNGGATGGGFSRIFASPSWQTSTKSRMRGLPDVAFDADPASGYQIIFQGQSAAVGGTSVAAPVFAAVVALANQARAELGRTPVTDLAKLLYQNPNMSAYRDIVQGNNSYNGVVGYRAKVGWDACTGFGSLDVSAFTSFVASH